MDPEIKALLKQNIALTEENNELLKKLRGAQKRAQAFKVLYGILILGLTIAAYVYVEPYLKQLMDTYSSVSGNIDDMKSLFQQ